MDLATVSLPAEIANLIFDFAGFECRGMASICSKALSGGTLWRSVTRLKLPVEDAAYDRRWKNKKFVFDYLSGVGKQILQHSTALRVLDIGVFCDRVNDIFEIFKKFRHQLVKANLPPLDDSQMGSILILASPNELQELSNSRNVSSVLSQTKFTQPFGTLRTLKLVVTLTLPELLSMMSNSHLPKLEIFNCVSIASSSGSNLWGPKGSLAKFARNHKSLRHVSLSLAQRKMTFEEFGSYGDDSISMKRVCTDFLDGVGIPLSSLVVQGKSALKYLLGENPSFERFMNGFSALYDTENTKTVSRLLGLQQCADLCRFSEKVHKNKPMLEFKIRQRNKMRELCPKIFRSKTPEGRPSYLVLCLIIFEEICESQEDGIEDSWRFIWEILQYDPHNFSYFAGAFWLSETISARFAQEPLERLQMVLTRFSAPILVEIIGSVRKLSRELLELACEYGRIPGEIASTVLTHYLCQEAAEWLPEHSYIIHLLVHTSEELQKPPQSSDLGNLGSNATRNLMSLPIPLQSNIVQKFGFGVNPRKLVFGEAAAPFRGDRQLISQLRDYTVKFCESPFVNMVHAYKFSPEWVREDLWIDIIAAATTPQQLLDWADALFDSFADVPRRITFYIGGYTDFAVSRTRFPSKLPNADAILLAWCKEKGIPVTVKDDKNEDTDEETDEAAEKKWSCSVM